MFHKILAPTDLSEPSFQALRQAMILAKDNDAELTLLRVLSNGEVANGELEIEKRHLDDMVRDYAPADVAMTTLVRQGDVTGEILRAAQDGKFDLIVMATHGYTGLQRWRHGSIADQLRATTTPLVMIRAQAHHPAP